MKAQTLLFAFFLCTLVGCSTVKTSEKTFLPEFSLLSSEVKSELRKVEKSVVGVNTEVVYEMQKFQYLTQNGKLVPDPASWLKYQLAANNSDGITTEADPRTLTGGGLIINSTRNNNRYEYTVLTSSHLVSPEDTTNIYYVDEKGLPTDVLFARFVLKSSRVAVRSENIWSSEAELLSDSHVDDLAIIKVTSRQSIGAEFSNQIGYELNLDWGDWVFLFGYPKGIKQMTGGWVSRSPYSRTLTVDAVVRFGYSGGPVFSLTPDQRELAFVGLVKSVPRTTLSYIGPDETIPIGSAINKEDLSKLSVKQEILVNYGTAYFVNISAIENFINSSRSALRKAGVVLSRRFFR